MISQTGFSVTKATPASTYNKLLIKWYVPEYKGSGYFAIESSFYSTKSCWDSKISFTHVT